MNSIIVLGDIRLHEVITTHNALNHRYMGGAMLVKSAIHTALQLKRPDISHTIIGYSADECRPFHFLSAPHSTTRWHLTTTQPRAHSHNRLRSCNPESFDTPSFLPVCGDDLWSRLLLGRFDSESDADGVQVPKIVVFDDLGLRLKDVSFDITLPHKRWTHKEWTSMIRNEEKSLTKRRSTYQPAMLSFADFTLLKEEELLSRGLSPTDAEIITEAQRDYYRAEAAMIDDFGSTFQLLMTRLHAYVNQDAQLRSQDAMHPVIIISASSYLPEMNSAQSGALRHGLWTSLHANAELRRRTIAILDVHDLRRYIPINTGLSWERTAQDTVAELERHTQFAPLLEFGYIVVRYGYTGVLLISNEPGSGRCYSLYFDPEHNDADWTNYSDGRVLGETAVLVSTLVEVLDSNCSRRAGSPPRSDLREAIDHAMKLGITRMQKHFCLGYGSTGMVEQSTLRGFSPLIFSEVFPISTRDYSGMSRTEGDEHDILLAAGHNIQRADVMKAKSETWSILTQSTQAHVNRVATGIVRYGTRTALNTASSPCERFRAICVQAIMSAAGCSSVSGLTSVSLDELIKFHEAANAKQFNSAVRVALERAANDKESLGPQFVERQSHFIECFSEMSIFASSNDADKMRDQCRFRYERAKAELSHYRERLQVLLPDNTCQRIDRLIATDKLAIIHNGDAALGMVRTAIKELIRAISKLTRQQKSGKSRCAAALELFDYEGVVKESERALKSEVFAAQSIIEDEINRLLVHDRELSFAAPIVRLGEEPRNLCGRLGRCEKDARLVVVDRRVIEGIRAIKRMIEEYLSDGHSSQKPLSIAVFGPPGEGKSLSVRKILEELGEAGKNIAVLPCNLSEFTSREQLDKVFTEINAIGALNKTPVVFFDEFDCEYERQPLGWLRFFLAPMEDGKYQGSQLPPSVFVFAGGTCSSFEEFSLTGNTDVDEDSQWFRKSKGPDFVSRLRGHLNVIGVNRTSTSDESYLIRRAVVIRSMLAGMQGLADGQESRIDDEMIHALLHVPMFKHGARSISMLLRMCAGRNGTISMSAVPPVHQLNMQVTTGEEFVKLISEYTSSTV